MYPFNFRFELKVWPKKTENIMAQECKYCVLAASPTPANGLPKKATGPAVGGGDAAKGKGKGDPTKGHFEKDENGNIKVTRPSAS